MKILLIDHNDSFTYNIVESIRQIIQRDITVINYKKVTVNKAREFDKIILSPGPSLPKDYKSTLAIIDTLHKTKPILGICLGHQCIGHYFNSSLMNLPAVRHGLEQKIIRTARSKIFEGLPETFDVGLYHSWVIDTDNFSEELVITSKTDDGIIMSVEHKKYPVFGIQFHPESFLTKKGAVILKNFMEL